MELTRHGFEGLDSGELKTILKAILKGTARYDSKDEKCIEPDIWKWPRKIADNYIHTYIYDVGKRKYETQM